MKKNIFLYLLLFSNLIFSQKVDYSYKNVDSNFKFELLIDNSSNLSQWKMVQNAKGENVSENNLNTFFVRKNNEFYISDKTISKRVLIKDKPEQNWKKTSETKIILGYECNSAIIFFRGRKYKAFYTKNILSTFGPWKFKGLEGLILEIQSEDNQYNFIATKIDLTKPNIDLNFITKNIQEKSFMNWNDFTSEYKNDVDNFIKKETCNCNEDGKNILKITKIEKIYPELHDTGVIY
ncbi:GLPGLI family protein [Elizabethkingia sp. JS20170427COW]|uniref:GLPGLI family protein n=1 Tax=Elizabethkingia sp. JS20170427COW TaxID=2583851 RepID=UPI001110F02E|nr:GLPGLI family protein [Elizabethkingia sp. JS20170427COW]QCX54343.1 GLPGLI family protein [Elizabethkingia sp. JS20170427COW]